MSGTLSLLIIMAILGLLGYHAAFARMRACYIANPRLRGASPGYYGWFVALYGVLPAAIFAVGFEAAADYLHGDAAFVWLPLAAGLILAISGIRNALTYVRPEFPARKRVERIIQILMWSATLLTVAVTLAIVASVLRQSIHFFHLVPPADFLFGLHWSPQTAMRADQAGASGEFGAIPLLAGTLMITVIALLIAVPVGLMSAIYLAEYAGAPARAWLKPMLELLAGIPTVVYGYFAIISVAPAMKALGAWLGLNVSAESALGTGIVMGIMIIPFVSSLSDDMITAVPRGLRDASYGLGATKSETIRRVVLRAALPGIMGSVLLAVSRAIGETMIVVMAAGLSANLTANPLHSVTTMTVQMVTLLVGDEEFGSAKTLAAFALGLTLFVFTLLLNIGAMRIVKKYREQYE